MGISDLSFSRMVVLFLTHRRRAPNMSLISIQILQNAMLTLVFFE
jgi:hypothetical protein